MPNDIQPVTGFRPKKLDKTFKKSSTTGILSRKRFRKKKK